MDMVDSKEILTEEEIQIRLQRKRHLLSQTNLVLKIPDVIGKEYFYYLHEKRLLETDIEILEGMLNYERSREDSCS